MTTGPLSLRPLPLKGPQSSNPTGDEVPFQVSSFPLHWGKGKMSGIPLVEVPFLKGVSIPTDIPEGQTNILW